MTHSSGVICRGVECEPLESKKKAISREIETIKPETGSNDNLVIIADKPVYHSRYILLAIALTIVVVAGIWMLTMGNTINAASDNGSTELYAVPTPSTIPQVSGGSPIFTDNSTHGLTKPSSPASDLLPPSAK